MNDEQLERDLRELFRSDAPTSAPVSLRLHAAELPRRVRPLARPRPYLTLVRELAVAAVAAAFIVALVLTVPRLGPEQGSASPVAGTANPSVTQPTRSGSPSATATLPATASGWSFRAAESPGSPTPVRGPDGTTYVATMPYGASGQGKVYALDPQGAVKTGWPFAPKGVIAFGTPTIAPDGTIYVAGMTFGSSGSLLWAIDPSGQVKPGWPYEARAIVPSGQLLATADGGAVFVEALSSGAQQAVALTAEGTVREGWPVSLPGGWTCNDGGTCAALGSDGTWYGLVRNGGSADAEIIGIRPDGSAAPGWPVRITGGEGFVLTAGGAIYAWGYDTNGLVPPKGITAIVRTRFLLLGSDGQAMPGWPVTLNGPAGVPTIAADGTLYTTTGAVGDAEKIHALGPDGRERAGWPYTLPTGIAAWPYAPSAGSPSRATSPSVGADGRIIVPIFRPDNSGQEGLLALTPAGEVGPSWPAWLPAGASFSAVGGYEAGGNGLLVPAFGGQDGTIYLAVASGSRAEILGFDTAGRLRPGWPRAVGDTPTRPVGLVLVPGIGLLVTAQTDGGSATLVALVPAR